MRERILKFKSKFYLFSLAISLFALMGCGLDIDFGGGSGSGDADKNEIIMGFIKEILPSLTDNPDIIVKAAVVKDGETLECCEYTTSERNDFSLEGDLDPEVELQFFESGDESSPLGTIRLPVFPGSVIDVQDILIDSGVTSYDYININFTGQVSSKNCFDDTSKSGSIKVKISSGDNDIEVTVQTTSRTDIERGDEEDLPCEEIVQGREVKVDGKLGLSSTVVADLIEIQ